MNKNRMLRRFVILMAVSVLVTTVSGFLLHYGPMAASPVDAVFQFFLSILNGFRTLLADPEIDAGALLSGPETAEGAPAAWNGWRFVAACLYAGFACVAAVASIGALLLAAERYVRDIRNAMARWIQDKHSPIEWLKYLVPLPALPALVWFVWSASGVWRWTCGGILAILALIFLPRLAAWCWRFAARCYWLCQKYRAWSKARVERVLLFGFSEEVKTLLENHDQQNRESWKCEKGKAYPDFIYRIHLVTDEELSDDEELQLLKQRVILHKADYLDLKESARAELASDMELEKADRVLLMEKSAPRNYALYLRLCAGPAKIRQECKFYALCESDAVRQTIETSFDSKLLPLIKERQAIDRRKDRPAYDAITQKMRAIRELTLFDLSELKANKLFEEHPLHSQNGVGHWDVHLLIAGFGHLGQQVLRQALNRGVLTADNTILIDVYDQTMEEKWQQFANSFHSSYVRLIPGSDGLAGCCAQLMLSAPEADGLLHIRFFRQDLRSRTFSDTLESAQRELNKKGTPLPITYAAVCIRQAEVTLHCLNELREVQLASGMRFPIAIRLERESEVAAEMSGAYRAIDQLLSRTEAGGEANGMVVAIPTDDMLLHCDEIFNDSRLQNAKRYNRTYNRIQLLTRGDAGTEDQKEPQKQKEPESADDQWYPLLMYKRRNNYRLYEHVATKRFVWENRQRAEGAEHWDNYESYFGKQGSVLRQSSGDDRFRFNIELEKLPGNASAEEQGKCERKIAEKIVELMSGTPAVREMVATEHRRWCYVMAMDGWKYGPPDDIKRQKLYLVDWERLSRETPETCKYDLIAYITLGQVLSREAGREARTPAGSETARAGRAQLVASAAAE